MIRRVVDCSSSIIRNILRLVNAWFVMSRSIFLFADNLASDATAIGFRIIGMSRKVRMAGTIDFLMSEKVRDPQILCAIAFVELDDASFFELMNPGSDLLGGEIVSREDFSFDALGSVLLATHIVDETPQANEQEASFDRALAEFVISERFGF